MNSAGAYANVRSGVVTRLPFRDIVALVALNVDVVTTAILAERDLSMFDQFQFTFINDGAFPYTVTVQTGESTLVIDAVQKTNITVPAAVGLNPSQNTLTIGPGNLRKFWRATGIANGGLTAARFGLKGIQR